MNLRIPGNVFLLAAVVCSDAANDHECNVGSTNAEGCNKPDEEHETSLSSLLQSRFESVPAVPSRSHTMIQNGAVSSLKVNAMSLGQNIQQVAQKMHPGPTRNFLQALNLCSPCNNLKRFGEDGDGGYVMCADGLDHGLVGAYSYGIQGRDGWGMAIAKMFKVPLHEYDCTFAKVPEVCAGCNAHFHNECIMADGANADEEAVKLGVTGASMKTLSQMLQDAGQANAQHGSLLLKIDVESAEWKIFAHEPVENMQKFRQIVVEYHNIGDVSQHKLYEKAVMKLKEAGFSVAHMHGNNYGAGQAHLGEYSLPEVIEVTYTKTPAGGCATNIPYAVPADAPNNPRAPEAPDAVLPDNA